VRRSLIAPSSAAAIARRSAAIATGWPWKLPPERISPVSANTIGLSVAEFISTTCARVTYSSASRAAPWTCGMQRRL
jgi:hypothetical protein